MEEFQAGFPTTRQESVDRIAEDPELVLYDNYFSIRTFEKFQKCLILDIPTQYDQKVFSYAFQKNSPYLDLFNHHLKVCIPLYKKKKDSGVCFIVSHFPLFF